MPPPTMIGKPEPKPNAALGKPGSPAYNAAYNNAFTRQSNAALYGQFAPLYSGMQPGSFGTPTATPGITRSPGQTFNLQQVLAGQAGGLGAQAVGGSPGTPAEYAYLGLPYPPQQTNLGAYSVQPDQFSSPPPNPELSYLGLPDYGNLGQGGYNANNPFQGLFGNQTDPSNFLSGWT